MVLKGQFLERPALIEAGELTLEGLFHRGDRPPPLLVCGPVGEGAGMDAPPCAELAWACARGDHASLRFQHRGAGASQGERDSTKALEDAEAARRLLAETAMRPRVAVAGYDTGCAVAAELARAHPEIARVVLVAPLEPPSLDGIGGRVLLILPEQCDAGLRTACERMGFGAEGRRLEIVPKADRIFRIGLPLVGKLAVSWLESA
jgi:pimeloyl-ACP methyl ester carboxylesterase